LFQKIQYAQAFAISVGQPYEDAMIVNVAYTVVFNTGLFPDACRAWQVHPAAQKLGPTSRFISQQRTVNFV
jgi:hypothetical protein